MMIVRLVAFVWIAFFMGGSALAQDNPILARLNTYIAAYNAKDAEAISAYYTEKAALLPPRSRALVGRPSIAAHFAKAFNNGLSDLEYNILEIDQTGPDTAVEVAETKVKLGAKTISGRSMHVWKKVEGVWFIHRDMYHVLGIAQ
ncbi:SgcJ/EcaC family oxidoreductase [uncultured Roseibium sp.]|uniref:YybH family protein n=1 Tax=uncultured Roseibium sp. TaxID=1936171 RepID=UPI00262DB198|nr:SgcJ/EcaC family oxidoreductase [uncultured Roseibium sp.]